nr:MAG: wsv325-like protein [Metapenaeopsis lamellata majanivirus]
MKMIYVFFIYFIILLLINVFILKIIWNQSFNRSFKNIFCKNYDMLHQLKKTNIDYSDDCNIHNDPYRFFATTNATFFQMYNVLNGIDNNDHKKQIILPQPLEKLVAFTIPYRSLVFNKNYKLSEIELLSYIGKVEDDKLTVTINCTNRPPVTSVVLDAYENNVRDNSTELLMCDCSDHYHLLKLPTNMNTNVIEIDAGLIPKLTFPFPGIDPIISGPSTTMLSSDLDHHPIMGSTLINRPNTLLLDLNGPCTGLPDGLYDIVDDNKDNKTSVLLEDVNYFLNTNPKKRQHLWNNNNNNTLTIPKKLSCKSGIVFNLE